jgi:hypothetical protein
MNTNQAYKKLQETYTMEEIQEAWKGLKAEGWNFEDFRGLLREIVGEL